MWRKASSQFLQKIYRVVKLELFFFWKTKHLGEASAPCVSWKPHGWGTQLMDQADTPYTIIMWAGSPQEIQVIKWPFWRRKAFLWKNLPPRFMEVFHHISMIFSFGSIFSILMYLHLVRMCFVISMIFNSHPGFMHMTSDGSEVLPVQGTNTWRFDTSDGGSLPTNTNDGFLNGGLGLVFEWSFVLFGEGICVTVLLILPGSTSKSHPSGGKWV